MVVTVEPGVCAAIAAGAVLWTGVTVTAGEALEEEGATAWPEQATSRIVLLTAAKDSVR